MSFWFMYLLSSISTHLDLRRCDLKNAEQSREMELKISSNKDLLKKQRNILTFNREIIVVLWKKKNPTEILFPRIQMFFSS